MPPIAIPTLTCTRCGHPWVPRQAKVYVCPKCHSPKWNEPRAAAAPAKRARKARAT